VDRAVIVVIIIILLTKIAVEGLLLRLLCNRHRAFVFATQIHNKPMILVVNFLVIIVNLVDDP
jgi:hypothetical protein